MRARPCHAGCPTRTPASAACAPANWARWGPTRRSPRLFLALERGVHDATRSIGALVTEAELPRYHSHLERVPLGAMLEGYARIVRRPDLSWELKQDVLHRLFEVSGLEVRGFLVQWHRELPASAPAALRADLERSIRRIPLRPRVRPVAPAAAHDTSLVRFACWSPCALP
jgi:hypothetical protein